jgi:hypothetical protein
MYKNLALTGSITGILGALICFIAGLARIAGFYYLAGYQSTTIFNVGVGMMVFACMVKLDSLSTQRRE